MPSHLLRKLQHFTRLSFDEKERLTAAFGPPLTFGRHVDVIGQGDDPKHVNLVLEGWICRYKHLPDGRRQIIAFLVPGDLCDTHIYLLGKMDHAIGTLSTAKIAKISASHLETITDQSHRLNRALWWDTLTTAAIQREWTVNLGQRTAVERLGHLMCEMYVRLNCVGLVQDRSFEMPLTQTDLADASGLSLVHLNRTLQELRRAGLISFRGKLLTIRDFDALQTASLFNPAYLHLDRDGRDLDAEQEEASEHAM